VCIYVRVRADVATRVCGALISVEVRTPTSACLPVCGRARVGAAVRLCADPRLRRSHAGPQRISGRAGSRPRAVAANVATSSFRGWRPPRCVCSPCFSICVCVCFGLFVCVFVCVRVCRVWCFCVVCVVFWCVRDEEGGGGGKLVSGPNLNAHLPRTLALCALVHRTRTTTPPVHPLLCATGASVASG
jgi:hypothetical protein